MKIYMAGASDELELIQRYQGHVRGMGHAVTHDWVSNVRKMGEANPRDASLTDKAMWSRGDLSGALQADLFWLLYPSVPSVGCWVEFGYIIHRLEHNPGFRTAQRVIVSGDWRQSIFTSLADKRFDTHEAALDWIGIA